MNKVNIKDYGAKAGIDCTAIFQKAEDDMAAIGGGIIKGQNIVYDVSAPFYHRSFNTLDLNGGTIRNSVKTKNADDQFCIYIGNFAPNTFAECVHFAALDIPAYSNLINLKEKGNAAFFLIGQTVLIDSTAGFMSSDGHWKPYAAFINKVKAVDAIHGTITLEDAVSINITGANIAPTNLFSPGTKNDKSYICQNAVIKDIRFESLGDWTLRYGCYKTAFENISIKATDAICGNGFSHCTFKNIRAEFSQKVIEMAMYSHDTTVDGLVATWWNGAIDPDIKPLLKMGENMRNCSFTNLNIDAGQGKNFGEAIRFEHAFNNKITNSKFYCKVVSQSGIALTTADANAYVQGNEVSGNTFIFGGSDYYMKLDNRTNAGNMTGNKIINNYFTGAVRKKEVFNNSDASNIIIPNSFLTQ